MGPIIPEERMASGNDIVTVEVGGFNLKIIIFRKVAKEIPK